MATIKQFLSLPPLTPSDLTWNPAEPLPISQEDLQLQADTINVLEGKVSLDTFSVEYQERIKLYWRFSATRQTSKEQNCAKRTKDTLDAI